MIQSYAKSSRDSFAQRNPGNWWVGWKCAEEYSESREESERSAIYPMKPAISRGSQNKCATWGNSRPRCFHRSFSPPWDTCIFRGWKLCQRKERRPRWFPLERDYRQVTWRDVKNRAHVFSPLAKLVIYLQIDCLDLLFGTVETRLCQIE